MRRNPASRGGFFSRSSGIVGAVKETFSKNLLMTGAGVILAPSLSKWVVDTFGPKVKTAASGSTPATYSSTLPGFLNADGTLNVVDSAGNPTMWVNLYATGFPILFGFLAGRFLKSKALEQGFYLGALAYLGNTYVRPQIDTALAKVDSTSAYVRGNRAFLNGTVGVGRLPGPMNHTAVSQFSALNARAVVPQRTAWSKSMA